MSDIQIILKHDVYLDHNVPPITLPDPIYAGDAGAQRIMFRVFKRHGSQAPVDLTGCNIFAHFVRPDEGDVVITGTAGAEWSYVDLPAVCYVYQGAFSLLIRITGDELITSVIRITGCVKKATSDTIIDPGTDVGSIEEIIAAFDKIEESKDTAVAAAETATGAAETATNAAESATADAQTATSAAASAQEDAQAADASAAAAHADAETATTAAGTATTKASEASASASSAQTSATQAAASAAQAMSGTPEGYADLVEDVGDLKSALTDLSDDYNAHIKSGINLFNPDDPDLVEDVEVKTDGTTAEKTGYFASGYIPIIPGGTFCCHYPTETYGSASVMVAYNGEKQRVGYLSTDRLTDSNGHSYIRKTFASNETAKYVRMTGVMASVSWYMYVYANEMPSTYTPYTTNKTLEGTNVDYSLIKNVSVSKKQTSFIDNTPVNLVDLSALVPGIITSSSSNGNIDTSGTYGTNWVTTDYIPVEPGATYALCIFPGVNYGSGFVGIPYYDADHNFLGRVKQPGGSIGAVASRVTITLPDQSNVKYIRASYYKSYTDSTGSDHKRWWYTQIFKASTWPGDLYVPYDDSDRIVDTRLDDAVSGKYNTLWGKSAIWNGDSICAADSDTGAGWPGRIATANGMKYKNYGIAGGTIAENTGSGVHSVSGTLDGMLTDFPNADYVIIEGGTNDADILGDNGLGTFDADDFSSEYIAALDEDTFSGALESIFYRLVTQMKGKHIGYLIPQKMGHTEVLVTRRRAYFDRAVAICQKWGIPYLDLWNGFYFNWRLSAHWDQSMTTSENEQAGNLYIDGQHLTTTGYAIQAPVIAEWMKTL